jgi:hypothetical protein
MCVYSCWPRLGAASARGARAPRAPPAARRRRRRRAARFLLACREGRKERKREIFLSLWQLLRCYYIYIVSCRVMTHDEHVVSHELHAASCVACACGRTMCGICGGGTQTDSELRDSSEREGVERGARARRSPREQRASGGDTTRRPTGERGGGGGMKREHNPNARARARAGAKKSRRARVQERS